MFTKERDIECTVTIDIKRLKICTSLQNVKCADGSTTLRCVVKWSLLPLVSDLDLKAWLST